MRIELEAVATATCTMGGHKGGARAGKGIENNALALGAILDGIGYELDRLDRRMARQLFIAGFSEAVDARIRPHIGAVAAMLAELNIIDMGRGARLIDEDQFVLAAVEAPHAPIGLGPHAEILELGIGAFRGG